MVAMVKPGDEFRVECIDWTGGQIKNNDNATDIARSISPRSTTSAAPSA